MPIRRFPPPWTVEELDACFIVRDHNSIEYHYADNQYDRLSNLAADLVHHKVDSNTRDL
jgi:hypothetical protein